jgi:hypothetical protein
MSMSDFDSEMQAYPRDDASVKRGERTTFGTRKLTGV